MGNVLQLPGTFCEICDATFREDGWGKQSHIFGFACSRCVTKSCRLVRRHNRRARQAGVKGRLFAFDWLSVLYAHSFACAGCNQHEELTLDHIRGLGNGGHNLSFNIQPLCGCCHMKKDNIPRREVAA